MKSTAGQLAYRRAYFARNREACLATMRASHLRSRYGITVAQYAEMLAAQGGGCALCGGTSARRLHVDHDPATGGVRGLLCHNCNTGVGQLGDDPSRCEAAALYLRLHAAKEN